MSYQEFVVGYLKMMLDEWVGHPANWRVLTNHLLQVIQGTGHRPWENVREWTQSMFDQIEMGEISWENSLMIQIGRVSTPMEDPTTASSNKSSGKSSPTEGVQEE